MLFWAAAAAAGPLELRERAAGHGHPGLELEIARAGGPLLAFWPHEGIAVGDRFEVVRLESVSARRREAGRIAWELRAPQAPEISLAVSVEPRGDAVQVRYRLRNAGAEPRDVSIAPCLQLPPDFLGAAGWARAKRVFVVTEEGGLRWIADTHQTRGRPTRAGEPDPDASHWAQHFLPAGFRGTPAPGLSLFGVADERAAADVIGAAASGADLYVVAAAEGHAGATFGLLGCLHAGLGTRLAPGEERALAYQIYVFAGGFDALLARVARDFAGGRAFARPPDFVPPDWRPRAVAATPAPGASGGPALELALELPASCAERAALSLDVWLEGAREGGAANEVALSFLAEGAPPERRLERLSQGKPRRLWIPLATPRAGNARLRLAPAAPGAGTRVRVEGVTLHAPRGSDCVSD